jgi:hypothetical protein
MKTGAESDPIPFVTIKISNFRISARKKRRKPQDLMEPAQDRETVWDLVPRGKVFHPEDGDRFLFAEGNR